MTKTLMGYALLAGLIVVVGCDKPLSQTMDGEKKEKAVAKVDQKADSKEEDHDGWWCNEHGVPEDECSLCSSKVAKAAKARGDWCDKHNRAKSICFICDPSLKDKYAAKYVAKFGKEPPAVDEEATGADKKK